MSLLDVGRLSWGINDERVYTCPCGSWQLHAPSTAVHLFWARPAGAESLENVQEAVYAAIRAFHAAMDDALWEHEADCPVLRWAATQAGVVRREPYHPYTYSEPEWYLRSYDAGEDGA